MNMFIHISLPLYLIMLGCGLFDADPKPLQSIDAYFYAEINGESFNANGLSAGIEDTYSGRSFLEFSGRFSSIDNVPYRENISLSVIYEEGKTRYPLHIDSQLTSEMGFRIPAGSYNEKDGDVIITRFEFPVDSDGFVTILLEELEDGRKTISGTFEMTVYLTERINTSFPQQKQDTLHITNGRYQMLLTDKRD